MIPEGNPPAKGRPYLHWHAVNQRHIMPSYEDEAMRGPLTGGGGRNHCELSLLLAIYDIIIIIDITIVITIVITIISIIIIISSSSSTTTIIIINMNPRERRASRASAGLRESQAPRRRLL